jgi:SAM-dependent methyltransferase
VLTHRDRYGFAARAAACWRCGLTALDPRMSARAYAEFYDGVYRPLVSAYHGRRIDADTIQDEQRDYAEAFADFVAPLLERARGERRAMLDVGGSTGVVAGHFARRFGLDAAVLDPAPAELAVAERLGIRTIPALLEEWQPDRVYDVVALFQTIDHLLDVAGALAKLRTTLAPHGLLLFDIVDFRAAYLRNASVEEAVKIDHPFYLVQETTEALLARAGFAPVRKSYAADHLHVAYACRAGEARPGALPDAAWVRSFFDEVRRVQNAPRP